jgi:hypothetical protein
METTETNTIAQTSAATDARVSDAIAKLRRLVAAMNRPGEADSEFDRVLDVLKTLSRKEVIPIAIVGSVAAIRYGYERLTNDLDVVIAQQHLATVIHVAPRYGIKVIWQDPQGWHKLQFEGVKIEVVPEGAKPNRDAPTTIPGPGQLGVSEGLGYASLEGWVETKLGSARRQDRADVVQVLKKLEPEAIARIREHVAAVHGSYLRLFEELLAAAEEEKQQEEERGGSR